MKKFLLILWLVCSSLAAQTIEIKAPAGKVKHGKMLILTVTGLDDSTRTKVRLDVEPKDEAHTAYHYGDAIIFEGEPKTDTKYTITLSMNEWKRGAETFFVSMKASGVPKEILDRQASILTELEKTHPYRYGTCVVEVAGEIPFVQPTDPTDPTPPVDPSKKVTQVTYVFEKDQTAVPRQVSLALRRINVESSGSVVATEFEEDSTVDGTPNGRVPSQYKIALEAAIKEGPDPATTADVPVLVVQSGTTVLRVIKAPTTEEQVMEAAK